MNINAVNSLPKTPQQREQIVKRIQAEITRLQNDIKENIEDQKLVRQNEQYIQTLNLRRNLIKRCGELSLLRLSHLEEVFKHYCTHVFRVGKHMTFDRLEYDKVHMTMERFFLFLRDFHMTTALIQQKGREVVDKNHIILAFKKISSNCRDLSFQEFVQAIQKLAIIYWDQKEMYSKKQQQNRQRLQKIKMMNEKRRKKKLGLKSQGSEKQKSEQKENEENSSVQKSNGESKVKALAQPNKVQNNENDDLVQELMKNQQIQDPNDEVREVAEKAKKQNAEVQSVLNKKIQQFQSLLKLSNEQKIENYYQLINIDSVQNYKNKLTELNLQNYINHNTKKQAKALSQSKLEAAMQQQEQRLMKLKAKMNEKKQKFKDRPLPKPSNQQALKEEQNSRRRKQMKKQRQKNVKQLKIQQTKKIESKSKKQTPKVEYKEGEVSWQMLQKLTLEHLKLKQFNLAKMYAPDQDDRYFLDQYGGGRPKISSRLQARERQSLSIVESTKMRAEQLQKKEKQKGIQSIKRNNKANNTSFSRNKI